MCPRPLRVLLPAAPLQALAVIAATRLEEQQPVVVVKLLEQLWCSVLPGACLPTPLVWANRN